MIRVNVINFLSGRVGFDIPFLLVIASAAVVMIGAFFTPLLDQDEMIYALVAAELLDGALPYQGVFDHKPIGIYYVYALFFSLLGEHYISIRVLTVSALLGAAFFVYQGLAKLRFSRSALILSVAVCLAFPIGLGGLAGNTEVILSFILSLIFFLSVCVLDSEFTQKRLVLVIYGALVAVGFSVNYLFSIMASFSFLALSAFLLYRGEAPLRIIGMSSWTLLGFLLASTALYSPYILDHLRGGRLWADYLSDQTGFLSNYGTSVEMSRVKDKIFLWILPFLTIIFGGILSFQHLGPPKKFVVFFAFSGFLGACFASSVSGFFFDHYWVMATTPLALLGALSVQNLNDTRYALTIRYGIPLVMLMYMVSGASRIENYLLDKGGEKDLKEANRFIQQTVGREARVVSIDLSPVYVFLNGLNVDQKYIFPGHASKSQNLGLTSADGYFRGLLDGAVDFIVSHDALCQPQDDPYIETCRFLRENFVVLKSFGGVWPMSVYGKRSSL